MTFTRANSSYLLLALVLALTLTSSPPPLATTTTTTSFTTNAPSRWTFSLVQPAFAATKKKTTTKTKKPAHRTRRPTMRPTESPTRPRNYRTNILVLLMDDVGWGDVEYINPASLAKTPNINAFANSDNTIQLNRFHSEISCTPSRIAILTGRAPLRDCVWGTPKPGLKKPIFWSGIDTVAKRAVAEGYRTLHVGKFPLNEEQPNDPAGLPSAVGFQNFTLTNGGNTFDFPCFCNNNNWQEDCYLGHYSNSAFWGFLKDNNLKSGKLYCDYISNMGRTLGGYPRGVFESDHLASLFEDWLEALPTDAAFLAHVSFRTNHSPYVASLPVRAACSSGDICNNAVTTQDLDWGGNLNQMDQAIGRIKDSLDRIRPEDDTLIFILSDNGPEKHTLDGDGNTNGLVGMKRSLFEGGLRVPAMIYWPAQIQTNLKSNVVLSLMDIPATIEEIIYKKTPEKMSKNRDGYSLIPLIANPDSYRRPKGFGVCSLTSEIQATAGQVCTEAAYYDFASQTKIVGTRPLPNSIKTINSMSPNNLLSTENDANLNNMAAARAALLVKGRGWMHDVFADFRKNCKGWYAGFPHLS